MVLESLGLALRLNWGNSSGHASSHSSSQSKKKSKKRAAKAEKFELKSDSSDGYYPGLVNISGTYCFMNSTVQALSSLSYLQPHIETIHSRAEALDVPTPVIDVLRDMFHCLNTPRSSPYSIRPVELISVLSAQSESSGRCNSLFNSREHQDAQELFQLLSECIKSEIVAIDKESARDRGLGGLSQAIEANREIGKSVFDGLTANRRSCVVCGYTEAVMHFAFDNWQLSVPRMTSACLLEDCLSDYTRLEVLKDCICRKCSMNATHRRLVQEEQALAEVQQPSSSKKRRLKEVKKMKERVKAALDEGRIEDDIKDVRMEKVISLSTKQAMIARPPPVLALHINRSMHFTHYASKNNIRVLFPEVLDLTPFTTSGNLSTIPTSSLSTPSPTPKRSSTPTPETARDTSSRTIYRLSAVVCHYGQHSFGHYVCFRRKPKATKNDSEKWKPPKLVIETAVAASSTVKQEPRDDVVDLNAPDSEPEVFEEYIWEDADPATAAGTGRGWLRISDDSVSECGIESVLQEGSGAFMLYYERAVIVDVVPAGTANGVSPYPLQNGYPVGVGVGVGTPLNSEETLKPQMMMTMMVNGNGSMGSLVSVDDRKDRLSMSMSASSSGSPPTMGARVVRSVAAGRGRRSQSAAPSGDGNEKRALSASPTLPSSLGPGSLKMPLSSSQPIAMPNGRAHRHPKDEDIDDDAFEEDDVKLASHVQNMSSSAPSLTSQMKPSMSSSSLVSSTSSCSTSTNSNSGSSSVSASSTSSRNRKSGRKTNSNNARIHSSTSSPSQSHHPPLPASPMVGLKA